MNKADAAEKVAFAAKPGAAATTSAPGRPENPQRPARTVLGPEQSEALREPLLADLGQLESSDDAADWVHKILGAKNTLIAADVDAVEAAFHDKLAAIDLAPMGEEPPPLTPYGQVRLRRGEALSCPSRGLRCGSYLDRATRAVVALRRRPFASATKSTASSSPCSRALSAAGCLPKRITFALPNLAHSAAKSATNSPSPYADFITAICTPMAMRPRGGRGSVLTRCPSLLSCGDDRTARSRSCPAMSTELDGCWVGTVRP